MVDFWHASTHFVVVDPWISVDLVVVDVAKVDLVTVSLCAMDLTS